LAIAERLARQGVFVYLLDRDEAALAASVDALTGQGLKVAGIALDLTEGEAVNAAFTRIHEAHGSLDFLVNNAGVVRDKRFLSMTEQDWDLVVDTNLRAQFLCCKAALPLMLEKGFGRIVNMSSRAWLGGFGQANYSAAWRSSSPPRASPSTPSRPASSIPRCSRALPRTCRRNSRKPYR
jgi:3-oxoacyl-[acyl-carrier protein] reductase